MKNIQIAIGGMSCAHCARAVEKALTGVPGVFAAQVNLSQASASVDYDEAVFDLAVAKTAVEEEGYTLTGMMD